MQPVSRRTPKPDPAPSRWSWRMQRLMLTPLFRLGLRAGLPFALTLSVATWYLSDPQNQAAIRDTVAEARASIEQRMNCSDAPSRGGHMQWCGAELPLSFERGLGLSQQEVDNFHVAHEGGHMQGRAHLIVHTIRMHAGSEALPHPLKVILRDGRQELLLEPMLLGRVRAAATAEVGPHKAVGWVSTTRVFFDASCCCRRSTAPRRRTARRRADRRTRGAARGRRERRRGAQRGGSTAG